MSAVLNRLNLKPSTATVEPELLAKTVEIVSRIYLWLILANQSLGYDPSVREEGGPLRPPVGAALLLGVGLADLTAGEGGGGAAAFVLLVREERKVEEEMQRKRGDNDVFCFGKKGDLGFGDGCVWTVERLSIALGGE